MLYADPSALTPSDSDLRPDQKGQNFSHHPHRLRLRGTVGLDMPCHAAVGSPYPLKTLFSSRTPGHDGTAGEALPHHAPSPLSQTPFVRQFIIRHL